MIRVALVTRAIDPAALIASIASTGYGAISLFAGTVRDTSDGRGVSAIDYSAYTSMAEAELEQIVTEAADRFGVTSLIVEHRIGVLSLGETSVAIAAAHAHRAPAFDCTRYVIEEIKKRVPIWKMEHYIDGTREWVDPTHASGVTAEGVSRCETASGGASSPCAPPPQTAATSVVSTACRCRDWNGSQNRESSPTKRSRRW